MGSLFSLESPKSKSNTKSTSNPNPTSELSLPLLLFRAQYTGQPLATVLTALRDRDIKHITVALKPRDTWSPPPRLSTGRVIIFYNADTLLVQDVIYE